MCQSFEWELHVQLARASCKTKRLGFYPQCSGVNMLKERYKVVAGALWIECVELSRTGIYGD